MEALNAQELDDSIFGTDQTLDWAEEADTMQGLSVDPFPSSLSAPGIRKESDDAAAATGSARGPSRHSTGEYGNNNNSRGSRDTRDTRDFRGRNQQNNNGRQSRQDGRSSRNHADVNGGYGGGRGDRGGDRGDRGGSKNRGGRSTSRTGYSGSQQGYPHGPSASASGGQNMGDGRPPRRSRDRSLSMERSGSIDRPRVWRGTTTGSRSRADKVDRWEHDKFDNGSGGGAGGQYQTGSRSRGRVRRGSIVQDSGPSPIDIEHIGKEGISHVTINRRGSNASSRSYIGTSYETPRRLGPDHSFDDRAGSEMHRFAKNQHSAAPAQSSLSPRSPVNNSNSAIHEPYRAPHRRKSSVDRSVLPGQPSATVTSPLANPAASIATDALQQQQQKQKQQSHQKKDIKDPEEDEGSSAEMEWENFVANGGLEMPLDRITDDLLRHPRRESTSKQTSPDTGTAQRLSSSDKASHNDYTHAAAPSLAHASAKQDKRPTLMLDDDDDTSDSAMGKPDSSGSDVDRAGGKRGSKDGSQGISIRGATKSTVKSDSRVTQPATEKAAASTSQAKNSGNGPTPERNLRNAGSAALQASQQQQQQQNVSGSDSLGIRIKGTSVSNGQLKTADIRTPSAPIRPAANTSRPSSPSKPDSASAGRSSSRSSSTEGRAKTISTPNTYLRRQFEGYDEDRGRHIFSVNIAYDENRHAPIHVHEKDDVVKLAAKFARTWRVYNKEQRIKQLLIKMKNLTQEAAL
ncbi:hypothetical protein FB645_001936 [Coemansia sp. IMI 203386]|nr:hypothetical protein FB645_001936 [Coemansia sp. IMI 203386]